MQVADSSTAKYRECWVGRECWDGGRVRSSYVQTRGHELSVCTTAWPLVALAYSVVDVKHVVVIVVINWLSDSAGILPKVIRICN